MSSSPWTSAPQCDSGIYCPYVPSTMVLCGALINWITILLSPLNTLPRASISTFPVVCELQVILGDQAALRMRGRHCRSFPLRMILKPQAKRPLLSPQETVLNDSLPLFTLPLHSVCYFGEMIRRRGQPAVGARGKCKSPAGTSLDLEKGSERNIY